MVSELARIPDMPRLLAAHRPITPGDIQHLRPTESMSSAPKVILEDREGNIWTATSSGLNRFRPNKLHSAVETFPLPLQFTAMTTDSRGKLWLASTESLLTFSPNQNTPTVDRRFMTEDLVSAMLAEPDGSMLVGIEPAALHRYVNGKMQDIPLWPHAKTPAIQALIRDHNGALWVSGIRDGLYRLNDKGWMLNGELEGLPTSAPVSMVADTAGKLWFGYPDNQVAVADNGQVQPGATQGLNVGVVLAITARGELDWVGGTDNVELYSRGRFWSLTRSDGHAFTGVSGIAVCDDGSLWLNGTGGRDPHRCG